MCNTGHWYDEQAIAKKNAIWQHVKISLLVLRDFNIHNFTSKIKSEASSVVPNWSLRVAYSLFPCARNGPVLTSLPAGCKVNAIFKESIIPLCEKEGL